MACPTHASVPDAQFRLGTRLQEIENSLYELHHVAGLLGDFACQHSRGDFSDGLLMERYATVFGWLSRQLESAHDHLSEIHQEIATS